MSKMQKRSVVERRQQVLAILTNMLHSGEGMQRMTTARLAEAVGVSEAALYRYFPSKTKMFEALIESIENNLIQRINQISKVEMDTQTRIHHTMQTILDFARKNPGFTRILTGHALMFEDDQLQNRVAKFFDNLELKFINILQMRKLREKKAFSCNEQLIAAHLVTFCEGQFVRYVRTNFRANPDQDFAQQWLFFSPIFA